MKPQSQLVERVLRNEAAREHEKAIKWHRDPEQKHESWKRKQERNRVKRLESARRLRAEKIQSGEKKS